MSPYELLGVERSASTEEIRKGYRRAAAKVHPDTGGEGEKFLALVKARDVLLNPIARDRYDSTGKMPDDTPTIPAVMMIRELAVQCAAKFSQVNLLIAIREALKLKRREFVQAAMEYKLQMERVESTWEPGDIKTHIIQEFYERKAQFDFHVLTADKALELLKTAKCNQIDQATISWNVQYNPFT
jgi:curved DNA-binding protein CbpA